MDLKQFFIEGMGCASYLIADEAARVAGIIDPDRDVRPYMQLAAERNLKITHIIETHLHADHVSGNTALAQQTGAPIYIHEAAQATFPHQALKHGDVLNIGGVEIKVLHTPGHTPDSVILLITDPTESPEPAAALTGDTLFVGDVGRPDLAGAANTKQLAAQLHESLFNTVLTLADAVTVYPGHGAGSLCGRALGAERSSTIGIERAHNPALQINDQAAFIADLTANLPEQPANYAHIKRLNRQGATVLGEIADRSISIEDALDQFQGGNTALLDVRPKAAYVEMHVPGSVYVAGGEKLSSRIGFLLPPEVEIVLLKDDDQPYEDIALSLARVGFEEVVGYIEGGIAAWDDYGLQTASGDVEDITPAELKAMLDGDDKPVVLDVREVWEFRNARVPGAKLIPLGEVERRAGELNPEQPLAIICASGVRSLSAAAVLARKGFKKMYNVTSGTHGWIQNGYPIERG